MNALYIAVRLLKAKQKGTTAENEKAGIYFKNLNAENMRSRGWAAKITYLRKFHLLFSLPKKISALA